MTLDKALKKIKTLKSELKLAKASYYEKCAEFNNIYIDHAKLQVKSKRFESNMKNALEIEKKNAIEEFVERFKEKAHKGASYDVITYKFIERDYTITESELDELLQEYKNEQEK